jgi:hypothetical protein
MVMGQGERAGICETGETMARTYVVTLKRTIEEETTITVEATSQLNAAAIAGSSAGAAEWSPKSAKIEVVEAAWQQGGE